jgi:hypothetical protein
MNPGFYKAEDGFYYFADCNHPVPTVRRMSYEAGIEPYRPVAERQEMA